MTSLNKLVLFLSLLICNVFAFSKDVEIVTLKNIRKKHNIEYIKIKDKMKMVMTSFPIASSPQSTWAEPVIPEVFVLKIANASVYSNHGIVIVDNYLIKELLWPWSELRKGTRKLDLSQLPQHTHLKGKVAVITQEGHDNYYHWITEIIPKILVLKLHHIDYDWLYMPPITLSFMKKSIELLGIDQSKIIESSPNSYFKADVLIVPSFVSKSCYTPKWVIQLIKDAFESSDINKASCNDKIFISRSKAEHRKIINEDEIFTQLKEYGFIKYHLKDLSLIEQIALFKNAKIIVAAHGASLTNLIFCKKDTKVVELFQEHEDDTYWYLSNILELKHYCIKTTNFKKNSGYRDTKISQNTINEIIKYIQ